MTPKRKRFARAIVEGANPSEAYRAAYATDGMSAKSIANEAHKLMSDPDISRMVREGEEKAMAESIWNRALAIERLERLNERCYSVLMANENSIDRDALNGFMTTATMLNEMCFVDVEVADARASFKADPERLKRAQDESRRVFEAELAAITS